MVTAINSFFTLLHSHTHKHTSYKFVCDLISITLECIFYYSEQVVVYCIYNYYCHVGILLSDKPLFHITETETMLFVRLFVCRQCSCNIDP